MGIEEIEWDGAIPWTAGRVEFFVRGGERGRGHWTQLTQTLAGRGSQDTPSRDERSRIKTPSTPFHRDMQSQISYTVDWFWYTLFLNAWPHESDATTPFYGGESEMKWFWREPNCHVKKSNIDIFKVPSSKILFKDVRLYEGENWIRGLLILSNNISPL